MAPMHAVVPWSFEPPDEDSHGLEGYAVEAAWGRPAGRARELLRVGASVWLVVGRELRVVELGDVLWVDHARTRVRLRISVEQLAGAPRLDPRKAVSRGPADAVRMLGVPSGLDAPPELATQGGSELVVPFTALALGLLAALAIFVGADLSWDAWELALFVLPAALLALAFATARRAARG